jgi:hypothetical protein
VSEIGEAKAIAMKVEMGEIEAQEPKKAKNQRRGDRQNQRE